MPNLNLEPHGNSGYVTAKEGQAVYSNVINGVAAQEYTPLALLYLSHDLKFHAGTRCRR
jgi:hypothetical protein